MSDWTRESALKWLVEHPNEKTMLDSLANAGVLENLQFVQHNQSDATKNLLVIADAAGYKTGLTPDWMS